ncbi:MAG: EscU/YscU/HrcU family type III secretion system export apparatus switch protein [Synergistaceae bacterium]|nr:EscU/YscU/HrcU family type III secretion system export apparatus switch protein [Synergistaceae bacterium]
MAKQGEKKDRPAERGSQRDRAVAVKYDRHQMAAPTVVAKGEGFIARKIVERAMEANVPIVEDAALVSALISLELGEEIPAELYQVVAKVLSWVYRLDRETGNKNAAQRP